MTRVILAAIFAVICLTIFSAKGNDSYLKTNFSIGKITAYDKTIKQDKKTKLAPSIGFGIGHYLTLDDRIDLMLEGFKYDFDNNITNFTDNIEAILITGVRYDQYIVYGKSLMLNYYRNIISNESYKIFLGVGIGNTRLKTKRNILSFGHFIDGGKVHSFPSIVETKVSKTRSNLSYALMGGIDMKLDPGINLELMYHWKDQGKLESKYYKNHNVSLGLRLDL